MSRIKAVYKSFDGYTYEKHVVLNPSETNAVIHFLDMLYDVDHSIQCIQNFELVENDLEAIDDKSR